MIWITADPQTTDGAELRCHDHEEWWAPAEEVLPTVIALAVAHFRDEHRVHVADCMCRDRVTDGRCVPHLTITGSHPPAVDRATNPHSKENRNA